VAKALRKVGQLLDGRRGPRGIANGAPVLALDLSQKLATQYANRAGRIDAHANLHAVDLEDEDLNVPPDQDALPWAPADN